MVILSLQWSLYSSFPLAVTVLLWGFVLLIVQAYVTIISSFGLNQSHGNEINIGEGGCEGSEPKLD